MSPLPGQISTGNVTLCQSVTEKEPSRKPSVMELLIAVLRHGFMVVAALTKALPIALIPKQLCIPSVWDDVVNHGCFHQASLLHASDAEGMCFQETYPCFLPPAIVSPDGCAGSVGVPHSTSRPSASGIRDAYMVSSVSSAWRHHFFTPP